MKDSFKSWIEAIVETLVIILVLYFVFFPFRVSGSSMENTLFEGDRVFASRIMTIAGWFETGDILIFEEYVDGEKVKMVKRVIALEGDHVVVSGGELYVNDELIDEDYALGITYGDVDVVVGKNQLFMLGDNREDSMDSRDFGVISKQDVTGRVILKAFPFKDFKVFL